MTNPTNIESLVALGEGITPVAWRYRFIYPGRVNRWIVRQTPAHTSDASDGFVAVEVEPLYAETDLIAAIRTLQTEKVELREAGNKLSLAAQTSGGTAGRDEGLQTAIEQWSQALSNTGKQPL